jgi:hypothetical protein
MLRDVDRGEPTPSADGLHIIRKLLGQALPA